MDKFEIAERKRFNHAFRIFEQTDSAPDGYKFVTKIDGTFVEPRFESSEPFIDEDGTKWIFIKVLRNRKWTNAEKITPIKY